MREKVGLMNPRSLLQMTFLAMLAVGMSPSNNADSAERDLKISHSSKYRRCAYIEATVPINAPCRVGWWQTLRYGHVRPHWGTVCY
jgi:hypothetical protein